MRVLEPDNPTKEIRHDLLKKALLELNRIEDFNAIIDLSSPPIDITKIAPPMAFKGKKVCVVGGGSAGLASAYELRKLGYDITVLEANPTRIGGRIFTHFFGEDLYGELGAMRIPVAHETSWHYINEFNLNTSPFIQRSMNNILYVNDIRLSGEDLDPEIKKYIYPLYNLTPTETNIPFSKLIEYMYNYPILQMKPKMRENFYQIKKNYPEIINDFDDVSLNKALQILGLSPGAIDLINAAVGIDRGLFYNSYFEMLKEMYGASFSYVYQIENGTVQLPLAFYKSLNTPNPNQGQVDFKQGCMVKGFYYDNLHDQVKIRYVNAKDNQIYDELFDYVVCAIPFSTLRMALIDPLFSNQKMFAIRAANYSTSQKTNFLCNQRFWEKTIDGQKIIGGGAVTDLPNTSMWFPSTNVKGNYGVLMATYNIGMDATRTGNLDDEYQTYLIKRQTEEIFGYRRYYLDSIVEDYMTINWDKDDYALGAFCMYEPCQAQQFAYASTTPEYNNRVFFAGEHTSPFHAWIQGALQSGMIAANQVAVNSMIRK